MKKSLSKICSLLVIVTSILIATGCKPKGEEGTEVAKNPAKKEVVKDPVSLEDIPSSGAKTFITTQAGASNFVKNINKNVDVDKLMEEAESVVNISDIQYKIEDIYDESEYAENLEETIEKIVEAVQEAVENAMYNGAVDINIEETPGAATDFPEGYSLDIPKITIKAKGSVNDINNPTSGSGEAEISTSAKVSVANMSGSIPVLNVNAKVNVTSDPVKQALKGEGSVGEKFAFVYEMPGLNLKINSFDNDLQIRGDYDGSKGSANVKLNDDFSSEFEFDAAKLGIPSSPVKYVKSITTLSGNLSGTPAMNSDKSFRGNVNYDYQIASKTGISFAATDGTGGKVVTDVKFNIKGAFNLAEVMQLPSILTDLGTDLFTGMKLTEEELKDKGLPFEAAISIKFFDDSNKETLDFLNIKSTYELYSFIYDYAQGLDEDDLEDLIDNLDDIWWEIKHFF